MSAVAEAALSTALCRTPLFSELEPHDRQECPLVAKQHGHSIATMLRAYAVWAEGAVEADVEATKRSMDLTPMRGEPVAQPLNPSSGRTVIGELLRKEEFRVPSPIWQ